MLVMSWEVYPWLLFVCLFVVITLIWFISDLISEYRIWKLFRLLGALLNMTAVLANGGRMPVAGRDVTARWWEPLTESSRLQFLCDIYFKCSIGDFILLFSLLVWIASGVYSRYVKQGQRIIATG